MVDKGTDPIEDLAKSFAAGCLLPVLALGFVCGVVVVAIIWGIVLLVF